jgi:hypothetical protein
MRGFGHMIKGLAIGTQASLLATLLVSGIVAGTSLAQSPPSKDKPAASAAKAATAAQSPYHPSRFPKRAELHYSLMWGVDTLSVKWAESGEMIRFSYRVLDADKARALNDKNSVPSLVDWRAGASLVVPSLEQVGQLRQSENPVAGKSYWMAFSNKGRLVKRGDHVDVVIGQFRANDLVVD